MQGKNENLHGRNIRIGESTASAIIKWEAESERSWRALPKVTKINEENRCGKEQYEQNNHELAWISHKTLCFNYRLSINNLYWYRYRNCQHDQHFHQEVLRWKKQGQRDHQKIRKLSNSS